MYVILCIDDNKNNLFTLNALLEQLDDIEVVTALSAQEGLDILLRRSIDLIFLDIQMPIMDGFEAAKLIKSNKSTAGIPIIFITAVFKSDEFKSRGYDLGAIEYITKPIDDYQLLNKVRLYKRLNESEKHLIEKNKELEFNQRYLKNIFEVIPNILITTDGENIDKANSAMLEFTGFKKLEDFRLKHDCICDLFLEGDGYLESVMDGVSWLEYIYLNPDKLHRVSMMHNQEQYYFIVWAQPLSFDEKQYSVVTFNDITELEKVHQALQEKEEIMLAQSRHAAMGEMISMIAHQWRQPITVISMVANNLLVDVELDEVEPERVKDSAEKALEQTHHLSQTIDDFTNFFRPNKKAEIALVNDILQESFGIIGKSLENNNIEVKKDYKAKTPLVIHSRELLQVFINILNNAKDALIENDTKNPTISVTTNEDDKNTYISICDNGKGIDPAIIAKIFDPYFSTKDEKNATGLGLYMSKTIVNKHLNGSIKALNLEKGGVCFEIALPKEVVENNE